MCENDRGKCSGNALCAVIDAEEVCYCSVGFQLLTPGGTDCIGKASTKVFCIYSVEVCPYLICRYGWVPTWQSTLSTAL